MIRKYITGAMALTTLCTASTPHQQADVLREEGKTLEALNLYNQALVDYQQKRDYHGVLGVLCGR